jgi:hypothetical protein
MIDDMVNNILDDDHVDMIRHHRTNRKGSLHDYLESVVITQNTCLNLDGDLINITEYPEIIKTFDWCETMIIDSTPFETLDIFPPNIKKLTIRCNKKLKKLDAGLLPKSITELRCIKNTLEEIYNLNEGIVDCVLAQNEFAVIHSKIPQSVKHLNLSENIKLEKIPELYNHGENIIDLRLNMTNISSIDDLHDNVKNIHLCKNTGLTTINKFPNTMTEFIAFNSNIETINCDAPDTTIKFDVYNNNLITCPRLGKAIKEVDLARNNLVELPEVDVDAEAKFDITKNDFIDIETIKKFALEHPKLQIVHPKYKNVVKQSTQITVSDMSAVDTCDVSDTLDTNDVNFHLAQFQRNSLDSIDTNDVNFHLAQFQRNSRHCGLSFLHRNPFINSEPKQKKYKVKLTRTFKL